MRQNSEEDYEHLSTRSEYWINKAVALRCAAGSIWYCMQVENTGDVVAKLGGDPPLDFTTGAWQVYRMLCGMSLELLYKAILVQNGDPVPKTHNLLELAERAGDFMRSPRDKGILELLTDCIVWEGRYPVPQHHSAIDRFVFLHYENLFRKERKGNLFTMHPIEPNPLDWDPYNEIWESAYALFCLMRD